MTRILTAALLVALAGATAPPCDLSKSGDEFCDDFCNNRCGFYNRSWGETGRPQNITLYRVTPHNVTGIVNKNSADAPGDITFVISKKNLTQVCLHDPTEQGCSTDVEQKAMYGEHHVEISGQWGPYQMCNPGLGWDTRNWLCGQYCQTPTNSTCPPMDPSYVQNGTGWSDSPMCWCDRTDKSVGRQRAPGSTGHHSYMPIGPGQYPPQCSGGYLPLDYDDHTEGCIDGGAEVAPYRTLAAWSFESAASMACQACYTDDDCTGWRSLDNRTVELFRTPLRNVTAPGGKGSSCVGARRHKSRWGGGGSWYGLTNLGQCDGSGCTNMWYSTRAGAQCAPGKPLGTDGCSWRLIETKGYYNATCVDDWADAAIETHGKGCFDLALSQSFNTEGTELFKRLTSLGAKRLTERRDKHQLAQRPPARCPRNVVVRPAPPRCWSAR